MCVATLNVSTQACGHRWYELAKACQPENNLANCPEKLKLQGWETRRDACPWCDSFEPWVHVHESTHRLFSSAWSASSSTSSTVSPGLGVGRSFSWHSSAVSAHSTEGSTTPISRHSSIASLENECAQKSRDMNRRLDIYLNCDPHEILPSAAENYPTYDSAQSSVSSDSAPVGVPLRRSSTLSKRWSRVRNSIHKLSI